MCTRALASLGHVGRGLAAPGGEGLLAQDVLAAGIARREVERHEAPRAEPAGDGAGLARGEVVALAGERAVVLGEHALDVQQVDVAQQRVELAQVGLGEAQVGDVAEPSTRDAIEHQRTRMPSERVEW